MEYISAMPHIPAKLWIRGGEIPEKDDIIFWGYLVDRIVALLYHVIKVEELVSSGIHLAVRLNALGR